MSPKSVSAFWNIISGSVCWVYVCVYVCASVLSSGSVSILSLLEPLKNTTTVTTARGGWIKKKQQATDWPIK